MLNEILTQTCAISRIKTNIIIKAFFLEYENTWAMSMEKIWASAQDLGTSRTSHGRIQKEGPDNIFRTRISVESLRHL